MPDKDTITELLNKPSDEWTHEELKRGFAAALLLLNQRTEELEATTKQRNEFLVLSKTLSQDLKHSSVVMDMALQAINGVQAPTARKLPVKAQNLEWVLNWYDNEVATYGHIADLKLIERYWKRQFSEQGQGEYKVLHDKGFRTFMSSFRKNYLVEARKRNRTV